MTSVSLSEGFTTPSSGRPLSQGLVAPEEKEPGGECIREFPINMERKKFSYIDTPSHERNRISGKKNVNEVVDGLKILLKMIGLFFSKNNK